MSFGGMAGVQSRIAAIEDKIAALTNNGRPPVALTESGATNSNNAPGSIGASSSVFASELSRQIASANVASSTPTTARGEIQGVPGTAEAFVEKVRSYIGVPYVWGGTNPEKGLDCSGLVQVSAKQVGVSLPRVTYDQQHSGIEVDGIANAKPGDLIICHKSGHVAVYIGNGKAIHAPRPGKNVTEVDVRDLGPIDTIRRVMRSADDAPAISSVPMAASAALNSAALAQMMGGAPAGSSPDLAASLVGALNGSGGPGSYSSNLSTLTGGKGTTSANAALLSQFMGSSSLYGSGNASKGLNSLIGGGSGAVGSGMGVTSANASLSNTASSMSALSAMRSSLGV